MAIAGIPIEAVYSYSEISDMLTKCNGNIVKTSQHLKINPDTLYEYFKRNPELWELVNKLRKENNGFSRKRRIDLSLNELDNTLYSKDAKRSDKIKVALYYLDNLGIEEGFGKIQRENEESKLNISEHILEAHFNLMEKITNHHSSKDLNKEDNNINAETRS